MRTSFSHYLPLDSAETDRLWKESRFVFDSCVLLRLYEYNKHASTQLVELLKKLKASNELWIPHHFASEFFSNRMAVRLKQVGSYAAAVGSIDKLTAILQGAQHPIASPEAVEHLGQVRGELEARRAAAEAQLDRDPILDEILSLFDAGVGLESSEEVLRKLCKDGEARYANRIPPGFLDDEKGKNKFGDLIGWVQIMEAAAGRTDVIFVTADTKEDWFERSNKEITGPHPLLRKEFKEKTQKLMYAYPLEVFLDEASRRLKQDAGEAIQEERQHASEEIAAQVCGEAKRVRRIKDLFIDLLNAEAEIQSIQQNLTKFPQDGKGLNWMDKMLMRKLTAELEEAEARRNALIRLGGGSEPG